MAEAAPAATQQATFLELMPAQSVGLSGVLIELEGVARKMRIQWKGNTAPDLAGLSRVLWEQLGVIQITPQMRILVVIEAVDGRKGMKAIDSLARLAVLVYTDRSWDGKFWRKVQLLRRLLCVTFGR